MKSLTTQPDLPLTWGTLNEAGHLLPLSAGSLARLALPLLVGVW